MYLSNLHFPKQISVSVLKIRLLFGNMQLLINLQAKFLNLVIHVGIFPFTRGYLKPNWPIFFGQDLAKIGKSLSSDSMLLIWKQKNKNLPSYTYSWHQALVWGWSQMYHLKPQKNYIGYLSLYIWLKSSESIF